MKKVKQILYKLYLFNKGMKLRFHRDSISINSFSENEGSCNYLNMIIKFKALKKILNNIYNY